MAGQTTSVIVCPVSAVSGLDEWALGAGADKVVAVQEDDAATGYIASTSTPPVTEAYSIDGSLVGGAKIYGVRLKVGARKATANPSANFSAHLLVGGSTSFVTQFTLTPSWATYTTQNYLNNPITGLPWVAADIQALVVAVAISGATADERHVTYIGVEVDVNPYVTATAAVTIRKYSCVSCFTATRIVSQVEERPATAVVSVAVENIDKVADIYVLVIEPTVVVERPAQAIVSVQVKEIRRSLAVAVKVSTFAPPLTTAVLVKEKELPKSALAEVCVVERIDVPGYACLYVLEPDKTRGASSYVTVVERIDCPADAAVTVSENIIGPELDVVVRPVVRKPVYGFSYVFVKEEGVTKPLAAYVTVVESVTRPATAAVAVQENGLPKSALTAVRVVQRLPVRGRAYVFVIEPDKTKAATCAVTVVEEKTKPATAAVTVLEEALPRELVADVRVVEFGYAYVDGYVSVREDGLPAATTCAVRVVELVTTPGDLVVTVLDQFLPCAATAAVIAVERILVPAYAYVSVQFGVDVEADAHVRVVEQNPAPLTAAALVKSVGIELPLQADVAVATQIRVHASAIVMVQVTKDTPASAAVTVKDTTPTKAATAAVSVKDVTPHTDADCVVSVSEVLLPCQANCAVSVSAPGMSTLYAHVRVREIDISVSLLGAVLVAIPQAAPPLELTAAVTVQTEVGRDLTCAVLVQDTHRYLLGFAVVFVAVATGIVPSSVTMNYADPKANP